MRASERLIHVITTVERGGAEKQLLTLVREQIKRGYRIEIIPIQGHPELVEEFRDVGAIVYPELLSKNIFHIVGKLRSIIKLDENILVHAHLPKAEIVCRIALVLLKNPFFVSRHNAEQFAPVLSALLSRFICSRVDGVIAISNEVKKFLSLSKEINEKVYLEVINYSYDPNIQIVTNIRKRPAAINKLELLTVGRLVHQKNYPFLFQALSLALKQYGVECRLRILGAGHLEKELKEFAKDLQLSQNVFWEGKLANIQEVINLSDALIMASLYEGFGLVLLEAMQLGLPIIAPRRSTFPEVLGDNYPGLFEPDSEQEMAKLIKKLQESDFYSTLSRASLDRLSFFRPEKMVDSTTNFYKVAMQIKD